MLEASSKSFVFRSLGSMAAWAALLGRRVRESLSQLVNKIIVEPSVRPTRSVR